MSNTDSFIDEVNEELARDRMANMLRRYGWIGIAVAVLIVGGAAVNEVIKARQASAAQAQGDAVLAALAADDPAAALQGLTLEANAKALQGLLAASQADAAQANTILAGLAQDQAVDPLYRDLTNLKRSYLPAGTLDADERAAILAELAAPGGPFRALAMEQQALGLVAAGDTAAALDQLTQISEMQEASAAQKARARDMILALGGTDAQG
jgi:hypothetical protein